MAINLDDMSVDPKDYQTFWAKHQHGRDAAELFPSKPKSYRRATADLANYASNKGTAMMLRAGGDIKGAQMYEGICQRIYERLPAYARW